MHDKDDQLEQAALLRRRALAAVGDAVALPSTEPEKLSSEASQQLLHELRVHQIELEMQNEELRRAHQALEISRARYFDLYDLAPVGYCTLSEDGVILEANLCAAAMLGVLRAALIDQPIGRFILAEDRDIYYLYRRELARNFEVQTCELRMVRPGGTSFWMRLEANIAWELEGAVVHRVVLSEITERKRAEAELLAAKQAAETSNAAKSRFLAAASHDLRQPIQAINLFNAALGRTGLNVEQRRISDYLSQTIHSLDELLNALLDISRLDAGIVKTHPEIVDVKSLFDKIFAELSPMASEKSLRLRLRYSRSAAALVTDRKLLMSLLGNLIGNAVKYTEKGGILVGVRQRGDQALIQVWDTGIGIPTEHIQSIFEEYFQVQNPARDRRKGLGLGLAIVRQLARLLGTQVVCRSRVGRGSVFEFRLPLAERVGQDESGQLESTRAGEAHSFAGRHAVVVEDDAMVATALQLALQSVGLSVTRYADAEAALLDLKVHSADVYVSDLRLPGLNGVEFLERVQNRSTKPFKGVLLTGDTSIERIEMAKASPWTLLFKPVNLSGLVAAIEA